MTTNPSTSLLDAADRIGAQLCRDAIWAGDRCNWLGPSMEFVDGRWQVVHRAFGPDFYAGTSGIALFLAHLYARTGEPQFERAAAGALRQALSRAEELRAGPSVVGVYSGLLGIALVALEMAGLDGSDAWHDAGRSLLDELVNEGTRADALDVVMGSAGAAPALLRLRDDTGERVLMDLAVAHGETLIAAAMPVGEGLAWDTIPGASLRPLTGFAHGVAGIAWALLELHAVTGDARFLDAARRGVSYEQTVFSPEHDNWPDFRDANAGGGFIAPATAPQAPMYGVAWCHGAPGIGLARLRAYELTGEVDFREHAAAALRATRQHLEAARTADAVDMSACHGIVGSAELLLYAADVLGDDDERSRAVAIAEEAAARYRDRPWPCGVAGAGETPGLMLGVAGIGLFLLRTAGDPAPPSVLLIGPRSGTARL